MLALLVVLSLLASAWGSPLKGFAYITFQAGQYQSAWSDRALEKVARVGTTHIELLVTWYQDYLNSTKIYPDPYGTPTLADMDHVMDLTRRLNLTVILKPHVDVKAGPWRGEIGPYYNATQWAEWFAQYNAYMLQMATWAQGAGVWAYNIGTEMCGTSNRTSDWRGVIATVKSVFSGRLLYGANWGPEPWWVEFWDDLDFIGVDAYYPMASGVDPNMTTILAHWETVNANMSALSAKWGGKPIIFAEIGYRTVATAAIEPGTWDSHGAPDMQIQVNLWQAFFQSPWNQPWLVGVFPWDWLADIGDGGVCDTGYSVNDKPAYDVFARYYGGQTGSAETARSAVAAPYTVYSNGATTWENASWTAVTDMANTSNAYPGHQASFSGILRTYGAISLSTPQSLDISSYSAFEFDIIALNPDQTTAPEMAAWLCICDDCTACSLRHRPIGDYTGSSNCSIPTKWGAGTHAAIPLFDLGSDPIFGKNTTAIQRIAIQIAEPINNTLTIIVDNIRFT